ncbi:MAG: winged helix DNA-binding protein [Planctomycetes bacterium]|nr:winged helix DNA-binding protein [Planctomycetota bacterium]MCP4769817.1 winged helix DNA-binding protein [Planctomycetota bacterium]MCP4859657.1 winged helix DNA-binding protein [Planctomycetota bacterium]
MKAADILGGDFARLFRQHGITATVFNAMRILIKGPEEGQRIGEIGRQLIQRVPDITRLIDRMERDGLVFRNRDKEDRRAVTIRLTDLGVGKCESLYSAVSMHHKKQLAHMNDRDLRQLHTLLKKTMDR